jgi:hypothetical protein
VGVRGRSSAWYLLHDGPGPGGSAAAAAPAASPAAGGDGCAAAGPAAEGDGAEELYGVRVSRWAGCRVARRGHRPVDLEGRGALAAAEVVARHGRRIPPSGGARTGTEVPGPREGRCRARAARAHPQPPPRAPAASAPRTRSLRRRGGGAERGGGARERGPAHRSLGWRRPYALDAGSACRALVRPVARWFGVSRAGSGCRALVRPAARWFGVPRASQRARRLHLARGGSGAARRGTVPGYRAGGTSRRRSSSEPVGRVIVVLPGSGRVLTGTPSAHVLSTAGV